MAGFAPAIRESWMRRATSRSSGESKELINRGGEKISPREIDETLLEHPAVAEACCFAIPDRVYGEGVAAAVVLKEAATEKDLIAHCRSSLSDFKCPTKIFIMDAIPRTATGKDSKTKRCGDHRQ
jgi:acyl-CoA synthetase (AMP-forming)/AMP-acid ligase II